MKSSINVRYNVYAPKAERNSASSLEQMHSVTQALNSAVRSSVKRLNSAMNTNDSNFDLNYFIAKQEKHCV